MIDKLNVIDFFNRCAPGWDSELIKDDRIIGIILDNAGVTQGKRVLDVACGTGVMVPYYLSRGAASVTGVDIAPGMIAQAKQKFESVENVRFICMDAETEPLWERFDAIVVYNAFPHFPNPAQLLRNLSGLLDAGGTLTVAHGMSREKIDSHHRGGAAHVSNGLMPAEELAELMGQFVEITAVISNDDMYQVTGRVR